MTKEGESPDQSGQAGEKITERMLRAGVRQIWGFTGDGTGDLATDTVREIYEAMEEARLSDRVALRQSSDCS